MSESAYALSDDALDVLFRAARTANTFTDEPVSDEQIKAIYELVKWGPTAMNTQPLRLVAVKSKDARERLVAHMSGSNKAKTATAPMVFVLAADHHFHEHLPTTFPHFAGAKASFDGDANQAKRAEGATFNGALQAGYFILAVRAAGLAAGPMLGFDKAGVDADFFPDGRWKSLLVVNVGKPGPDAWKERLPRLDASDAVKIV
jgi:3-hydroxypropanoate dehydrogenase